MLGGKSPVSTASSADILAAYAIWTRSSNSTTVIRPSPKARANRATTASRSAFEARSSRRITHHHASEFRQPSVGPRRGLAPLTPSVMSPGGVSAGGGVGADVEHGEQPGVAQTGHRLDLRVPP